MSGEHSTYEEIAGERRGTPEYREGYAEARRAFLIGQAVRDPRIGTLDGNTESACPMYDPENAFRRNVNIPSVVPGLTVRQADSVRRELVDHTAMRW